MSDIDARLARVLAAIQQPGPVDDSWVTPDRDADPPQWMADQRADEAADLDYYRRTA